MAEAPSNRIRVLIVSLPGIMQNVLREMLARRSDVMIVGVAYGCLSAVGMIHRVYPDLVVIDSNLPEPESSELIRLLKKENPFVRSLLLVETTQQQAKMTGAGADLVLTSYSLPNRLDGVVGRFGAKTDSE